MNGLCDSKVSAVSEISQSSFSWISCILQCIPQSGVLGMKELPTTHLRAGECAASPDLKFKSHPLHSVRKVMEWKVNLPSGDQEWTLKNAPLGYPHSAAITIHVVILHDGLNLGIYVSCNIHIKSFWINHQPCYICSEQINNKSLCFQSTKSLK